METEMVAFLKRVGKSLIVAFFWLVINVTAAIKGDNAFVEGHVKLRNILFYLWFVISLIILLWILKKIWYQKA